MQSKFVMAEIAETKEESMTGITYKHWDMIEVWETRTHINEAETNDQFEIGTNVIRNNRIDIDAID